MRPLLSLERVGPADSPRDIVLLMDEPLFGFEAVVREAVTGARVAASRESDFVPQHPASDLLNMWSGLEPIRRR